MWSPHSVVLCALVSLMSGMGSSRTTVPTTPGPTARSSKVIESFHVTSDIRYRFATTKMVSVVRNTDPEAQEISFDVTLPKEAFIVSFSMFIEGVEYPGEVKEKFEAKKQYQAAVDRGQSAGHVRQAPRHANVFQVSVNVAADQAVNFTLSYQEVLRRKLGRYEHEVHVSPGMPVQDFLMEVHIQENRPLTFVKTPALRENVLITNRVEEENTLTVIDRPTAESAHVTFRPTVKQQGESGVDARFAVQYDVEHAQKGDVLMVDGYFIHLFSPDLPALPKDIIFVLDVSGSMSGEKMGQLKVAMKTILSDLQPIDRFNIMAFSSNVHKWRPQLVGVNDDVMSEARSYVESMRADGMTNINQALLTAVRELQTRESKERVGMIFFLTDGLPTAGVTSAKEIAKNVYSNNENSALIFALAFGSGADYDSLKTISIQNSGFARKIYVASDADLQVTNLYREISAVALKDVKIRYMPSSVDEFSITEHEFPVVFNGSEIIVCGRMAEGAEEFGLEITARQKSGEINLILEVDEINNFILTDEMDDEFYEGPRDYAGFVEKMWAYLTIKQMLREKDALEDDDSKATVLKEKIIKMSLKYKFVTPLTSMVVTKPEETTDTLELADLEAAEDVPSQAMSSFPAQSSRVGHGVAVRKRKYRPSNNRASHPSKHFNQASSLPNKYHRPGLPGLPPQYSHTMLVNRYGNHRGTTPSFSHYHSFSTTTTTSTATPAITPSVDPHKSKTSSPSKSSTFPTFSSNGKVYSSSPSPITPNTARTLPSKEPGRASSTFAPVDPHGVTSRATFTPYTSSPSTTPGKKRNNKNKKNKRGALLVAMVGTMNNVSICLSPRKLDKGRYVLMDSLNLNGSRVEVQTSCSGKSCKGVNLSSVRFTSPTGLVTFSSTPESGKSWTVSNTSEAGAMVSIQGQSFSLKAKDISMTMTRVGPARRSRYILTLEIGKPSRGLLGDADGQYRVKRNRKNNKVPGPCRAMNADINKSLRNKAARKYKLQAELI